MTVLYHECDRCEHRISVEDFDRWYGHMFDHSMIWCDRRCTREDFPQSEGSGNYVRVFPPPTMPVPLGRRRIAL